MTSPDILSSDLQSNEESPEVSIVYDITHEVVREAGGIENVAQAMAKSYLELKPMLETEERDFVVVRGEAPHDYEVQIGLERMKSLYEFEQLLNAEGFAEEAIEERIVEFITHVYLTKSVMETGIRQRQRELDQQAV